MRVALNNQASLNFMFFSFFVDEMMGGWISIFEYMFVYNLNFLRMLFDIFTQSLYIGTSYYLISHKSTKI